MRLDENFMKNILLSFEENEGIYMPVALLARNAGDIVEDGGHLALSEKFVFHLLHLQDLGCIENAKNECSWGYQAFPNLLSVGDNKQLKQNIEASLQSGIFETKHCYDAISKASLIRLNATGIQLSKILNSSKIKNGVKATVLEFGKAAIPAALTLLMQ